MTTDQPGGLKEFAIYIDHYGDRWPVQVMWETKWRGGIRLRVLPISLDGKASARVRFVSPWSLGERMTLEDLRTAMEAQAPTPVEDPVIATLREERDAARATAQALYNELWDVLMNESYWETCDALRERYPDLELTRPKGSV